ncbi:MAG TPA: response regulator transcription factor [Nitrospirota bacterium]|nr:response regulator transcription factor [Nitrospirota bacterium]
MSPAGAQTTRILVVDDEPDLVELVTYNLTREGFKISSAPDAEEALDMIKKGDFGLVILDRMLPGLQGTELCRIIRSNPKTASIPIIMLTAKGEVSDKIQGLETGADDYMAKPFSPKELTARVNAVLRRTSGKATREDVITLGNLRIDRERYVVLKNKVPLNLSSTEFKLLLYLVERRGRVFSRDQLLDAIWQNDTFVEPRTVDVHVRRLRTQIEDDPSNPVYIKTRRGVGYYVE